MFDEWYYGSVSYLYGDADYDTINSNGFTGSQYIYYKEYEWDLGDYSFLTGNGYFYYYVTGYGGSYIDYDAKIIVNSLSVEDTYYNTHIYYNIDYKAKLDGDYAIVNVLQKGENYYT